MSEFDYEVKIPENFLPGLPGVSTILGRVTVLLGPNGSGKSKVLTRLSSVVSARPKVFVEGGRAIALPNSVSLNRSTIDSHGTPEKAAHAHKSKQSKSLVDRVRDALITITKTEESLKAQHSDAVAQWVSSGKIGECPERATPPLERLSTLFFEVFPLIRVLYSRDSQEFTCSKSGSPPYNLSEMSDGEKQVFSLLADLAILADPKSHVAVDEPELNLNPLLACRVWETIERALPDAVFVYSTHCLSFAMRDGVTNLLALSPGRSKMLALSSVGELTQEEARHFLGAIPGILAADRALAIEGEDESFDLPFYEWLLERKGLSLAPLGDCIEVAAASRGAGVWEKIAPLVRVVGVVDRDFRSEGEVDALRGERLVVLELHEAESYLCHPELLAALASRIGTLKTPPSADAFEKEIRAFFESERLSVAANRTFARCGIRLGVSISGNKWKTMVSSKDSVVSALRAAAVQEAKKVDGAIGPDAVEEVLEEELERCKNVVTIEAILALCPGKELLAKLAPIAGCKQAINLMYGVKSHLRPIDFPHLSSVRERLTKLLA